MPFVPRSQETIVQEMVNRIVARSDLSDLTATSQFGHVIKAVARQIEKAEQAGMDVLDATDIDIAVGTELDEQAKILNVAKLARLPAANATGNVVFSRTGTTGLVNISAGQQIKAPAALAGEDLIFVTTASGSIADGAQLSGNVAVQALASGTKFNVDPAMITSFVSKPSGVDAVTNPASAANGTDLETDDSFRKRIRAYIASLPRGTRPAIEGALLGATSGGKTILWVSTVEDKWDPGNGVIYIDDGNGTAESGNTATRTATYLVHTALGGEVDIYLADKPIKDTEPYTFYIDPVGAGPKVAMVEADDYWFDPASGHLKIKPTSTHYPLATDDEIYGAYTYYTGLMALAQKIVDGDAADRENYPGYGGGGVLWKVRAPTVIPQSVTANITVRPGYDLPTVITAAINAISDYINHLGTGEDVLRARIVDRIMDIAGVYNVRLSFPLDDVVIGETQIARITTNQISVY